MKYQQKSDGSSVYKPVDYDCETAHFSKLREIAEAIRKDEISQYEVIEFLGLDVTQNA